MRVSLTFDDGPNTSTTVQVLEVLEKYNVPASFFLIGQNISEESSSSIKRAVADGCTIECHSWSHPAFPNLTAKEMLEQIKSTNVLIEKYAGAPPMFFRPPYIALNQLMFDTIDMPFIQGFGADDWDDNVSADQRANTIINHAHDGQIILLHDMLGNTKTVEALDRIISELKSKGAQFYNIRDLFKVCGVNPKVPNKIWTDLL